MDKEQDHEKVGLLDISNGFEYGGIFLLDLQPKLPGGPFLFGHRLYYNLIDI